MEKKRFHLLLIATRRLEYELDEQDYFRREQFLAVDKTCFDAQTSDLTIHFVEFCFGEFPNRSFFIFWIKIFSSQWRDLNHKTFRLVSRLSNYDLLKIKR